MRFAGLWSYVKSIMTMNQRPKEWWKQVVKEVVSIPKSYFSLRCLTLGTLILCSAGYNFRYDFVGLTHIICHIILRWRWVSLSTAYYYPVSYTGNIFCQNDQVHRSRENYQVLKEIITDEDEHRVEYVLNARNTRRRRDIR